MYADVRNSDQRHRHAPYVLVGFPFCLLEH